MRLQLITYGKGNQLDIAKFELVKNREFTKPRGGLWASPVGAEYGWSEWCEDNNFGDLSCSFTFEFDGNVFVVDGIRAARRLPWINCHNYFKYPDFEKILSLGYDAIWLTCEGEQNTRHSMPSFYGWDCESVLVMNPSGIVL